jgi:hypothetical protein
VMIAHTDPMSFCDHCEGQRFDRSRVLRLLRRHLREDSGRQDARQAVQEALSRAIEAVRSLDIPHLEELDDIVDGEVVH